MLGSLDRKNIGMITVEEASDVRHDAFSPKSTADRRRSGWVGARSDVHNAAAQDLTLTYWNTTYPLQDPNDKTKKPEDFYISKAIARFEAANPGITVQMEDVPSGNDMFIKYRTASVAQNGPDVMGMWSGSYMLGL